MLDSMRFKGFVHARVLNYAVALAIIGSGLTSCSSPPKEDRFVSPPMPVKRSAPGSSDAIKIGETVEVFVLEDPQFNGIYKVREKGDIIIPKVGRIDVAGLSPNGAQQKIKGILEGSQLKTATVIADRLSSPVGTNFAETPKMLIFVTGKVARPGQHLIAIENGSTIYAYEALLIAGGIAPFADERKAYILRRNSGGARQRIDLDIRSIRQGSASDIPLSEGDMICVPEKRFAL